MVLKVEIFNRVLRSLSKVCPTIYALKILVCNCPFHDISNQSGYIDRPWLFMSIYCYGTLDRLNWFSFDFI